MYTIDYTPYKFRDKIDIKFLDWDVLSQNPRAVYFLTQNKHKINWFHLSANSNAILLLEQNQDKIVWDMLAHNTNAIHLLEHNLCKLTPWDGLSILAENSKAVNLLFSLIKFLSKIFNC